MDVAVCRSQAALGPSVLWRAALLALACVSVFAASSPLLSAAAAPAYSFSPSGHDGGGGQSAIAADPNRPGTIIAGGDIWGLWRSRDYGRDWHPVHVADVSDTKGVFNNWQHLCVAAVKFSAKTPNRIYAGVGSNGNGGGFLRSDNGGDSWILTSTAPQFAGDNNNPPLVDKGHPRSVGNLIALDASQPQEYVYVGTFSKGVMRSTGSAPGASWATIALPGLTGTNSYVRGMAISDIDPSTVYAAVYDTDNDSINESIYLIENARTATAATLVAGTPFLHAEEIAVINGTLYVAANDNGVWKYDGAAWEKLYSDSFPSQFYSIDGYWDSASSQAVIYAGTTRNAKPVSGTSLNFSIIRSRDSGATWTCITADPTKVHPNMPMGDATGDIWWKSTGWGELIGGTSFQSTQILIDPSDSTHRRVYAPDGWQGTWRTDDALTVDNPAWYPCMRHLNVTVNYAVAPDPNRSTRAYCLDYDWTFMYSTDNFSHFTQKSISFGGAGEYCLALDSTTDPASPSAAYVGRDGALAYCANPITTGWVNTNLPVSRAVKGCSVKKTAAGTIVLAAVADSGIWRKIGAGASGSWGAGPVHSGGNVMRQLDGNNKTLRFSWGGGSSQMVYFTDKENGVFRSMDSGASWIKITAPAGGWAGSGFDTRFSGSVAVDPTDDAQCYVTQTSGVWFSTDANAPEQPTFTRVALPNLQGATPGFAAYDDLGNVFINTKVQSGVAPKMYYKAKGGNTWEQLSVDNVFKAMGGFVRDMRIGPAPERLIYLASNYNGICIGKRTADLPLENVSELSATPGSGKIDLAWKNPATGNFAGVRIQRSTSAAPSDPDAGTTMYEDTGSSYSDAGLINGTTYFYSFFSKDFASNFSTGVSISAVPQNSSVQTHILISQPAEDGYVVESGENTNVGGSCVSGYAGGQGLRIGDNASHQQIMTILSFNTSSLPANARLLSARLELMRGGISSNPSLFVPIRVDICRGAFGNSAVLENNDFEFPATAAQVAELSYPEQDGDCASGTLSPQGLSAINLQGATQFRLYFSLDDDDDSAADYLGFHPGDSATDNYRPRLVLTRSQETSVKALSGAMKYR